MTAATALAIGLDDMLPALQRQAIDDLTRIEAQRLQSTHTQTSPLSHEKDATSGDAMSGSKNTQTLRERLSDALRRRVGKGRAVTVKQVARALYPLVTERTIENLIAGNNEPRSETLILLMDFFDQSFADEVFAGRRFRVVKLCDPRAADAAQKIIEGNQALKALDGA